MHNRPATSWLADETVATSNWDPDRAPGLRLTLLWLAMLIPLVAVVIRMAQLQLVLQDGFISGFEQTYETEEEIPARHGRILAADGSILAGEDVRYDLQIHYRLIQEPADERWLRAEALRNLDRVERKDKQRVEQEKQRVLERRDELWATVAKLTGTDSAVLSKTRTEVQQRLTRMKNEVVKKRARRLLESESMSQQASPSQEGQSPTATGLQAIWNRVRKELTEPPARSMDSEPLIEEIGFHTIVAGVNEDVKAEIEAHPERYPGMQISMETRRTYPQGELASHLIGTRTPLSAEEWKKRRQSDPETDLHIGDPIGRSGLELKYDEHLRGTRGLRRHIKNRRGEIVASETIREPQNGRDLVLTVDVEVQRRAEQVLDQALQKVTLPDVVDDESHQGRVEQPTIPQGGCIVAIDVHSGAILAAASAPRFDLNLLTNPDRERWRDLMEDPRKPLFSRATQMALAPGSVFKIISAVAAVESGKVNPDIPIACRGYLDNPDQHRCLIYRHHKLGHGDTRLADALCQSCNVYFFTAARRMGPAMLVDWSRKFGIGQPTGVDLPSEGSGHLPYPGEVIGGNPRRWHPAETLGLAIGQADLLVTPLQMARVMAAVANGGQLVTPHMAAETGPVTVGTGPSFRPVFSHPEPQPIEGLRTETLAHIREGLEMVVNHPRGTAYKTTHLKEIRIAGKTGTAESGGADHAWFAGYVPADQPRIAFVVVLEHGGSGGKAAGPVAKQLVKCLLDLGLVSGTRNLAGE